MRRLLALSVGLVAFIPAALAAGPFLLKDHSLHATDALILESVNEPNAQVVYVAELASITSEQARKRTSYQRIGCEPFSVQDETRVIDDGYQCHTFFCVGYRTGTKLCKTHDGRIYGGVVEINRRMTLLSSKEIRTDFQSLSQRTASEQKRVDDLAQLACTPFYVFHWDVGVGEGYRCAEIGKYPDFSPAVECIDDWRVPGGFMCSQVMTEKQLQDRASIVKRFGIWTGSSASSASSQASSVPAAGSGTPVGFSDVISGYYGYTAIISLAERGVVKGYPDGTFRPKDSINRAEFLKMLIAGLYPEKMTDGQGCFPDVARQWFAPYVCAAKNEGWVGGYSDGQFRPGQTLRKAEGLKIVMSALGVPLDATGPLPSGVSSADWFTPYVRKAVEMNILLETSFDPGAWATRADTAVWMYRAAKAMEGTPITVE
jgi:S-layer homology domain